MSSGANAALLKWTPLMLAIAQGSLSVVEAALAMGPDLTARDSCLRTPWLLSVHTGDVAKARLLLAAGANRQDRGQCGKPPLMYPTCSDHADMLRWLLSEGFDPNDADDFKGTPLMEAAVRGITRSAKILIDAGADIHLVQHGESAVRKTTNLEIVRLLVDKGADLNDISDEMRSELTRLPNDQRLDITRDEYLDGKQRRFGQANPEKMNVPFWKAMVTSGANAYTARRRYDDDDDEPVWCFKRFGKSINELSDGRIIEIAGEHEDYYDPDFCIYNDVVVHHGDGTFDIYGYPKACFPPTDFHTATLVGKHVYIVGCLGYLDERRPGDTPVYRLDIETFEIQEVPTTGEKPGWIHRHKAVASNQRLIRISGGEVYVLEDGKPRFKDNPQQYALDLESMVWCKTS
jgi:ankyrin repeat protein